MRRENIMPPTFLRRNWNKHSRLGKNKRKKQVWRSPKGRHNKMRRKRKGYPAVVSIGYKNKTEERGTKEDKKMVLVNNLKELEGIGKEEMVIIGKVGNKKRTELVKKAKEKGIHVYNINVKRFLKTTEKKENKTETKKK
jgi:large subunit ribosomal protein L32e